MLMSVFRTRRVNLSGLYFVGCRRPCSLAAFDIPWASSPVLRTSLMASLYSATHRLKSRRGSPCEDTSSEPGEACGGGVLPTTLR